jgi:hypothetical protein
MPISCAEVHVVPNAVLAVWHRPASPHGCSH